MRVKDIVPGAGGSDLLGLISIGSNAYFAAGTQGGLWTSDGTAAGTVQVSDLNSRSGPTSELLFNVADNLYFVADDDAHGDEPWILRDAGGNLPPTVDAGGPYSVIQGGSVVLNGSGRDPEGDPLTLTWDLDDDGVFVETGLAAQRGNEVGATPTFQAPASGTGTFVVTSISINGNATGTLVSGDHFGFVAQRIDKFAIGSQVFALSAGNDNIIPFTNDVRLLEVS
jgi:ELWxxDGT repeat protein